MLQRRLAAGLALVAALLAPAAEAQNAPSAADAKPLPVDAPVPTDSAVTIGTLPNGVRYYIRENHRPEKRAELRLVVNAGSILEDSVQRGLAHVVEHMAFSGTTHFPKQALVDYLEATGVRFGADLNAYTSFDETVYQLTVPTDSAQLLEKGFQILEDWAHGVTFDSAAMERERKVVTEEWRLGRGAASRMRDKQFPVLFQGSRYANRLPIGDKHILDTFKRPDVVRFYNDWYRPDLIAVVAVGDFDKAKVERLITERFAGLPARRDAVKRPTYPVPDADSTLVAIATDPEATRSTVSVYWKQAVRPHRTVGDYREQLVEALYDGMLNERLDEIAQRPDAPFVGAASSQGSLVRTKEAYTLSALVKDGGIERGLKAVLTEAERVAQHGFTPTELERQKREMLRGMEQAYAEREKTNSGAFVDAYIANYLEGEPVPSIAQEYELQRRLLPGITIDEVNRLAREWVGGRSRVVLVSAPQKAGVHVPDAKEILAIVDATTHEQVAAYVDSLSDAPLVSKVPARGRVVASRSIPSVGVTEWTLSNGVRVLIKPTDFKADEIVFRAWAPGGTSIASDADYPSATASATAVDVGGIGQLNAIALQKALADKQVSVSPFIGAYQQGVSGGGSPKDLETMFQLIYLTFTAPRADTAAFQAYRQRAQALLANRAASPQAAFGDTIQVTLAQHHPRAKPPSPAFYDRIDLGTALRIYRDRFADAGAYTFVFVGNIDTTAFRPLVEQWLGSLPSSSKKESFKDVGLTYPTGVIRREVRRGVEPKAETQLIFTGPYQFTRENLHVLSSLTDVLEIRLRERLREALGGTYGVSVDASPQRIPRQTYEIRIDFGSAPERAAELTRAVFAEIDSLKRNGPSEKDLQKVRETQLRERETNLRRNGFWAGLIYSYDFNGWDLGLIPKYTDEVRALDTKTLRDAARRYFDEKRYVEVRLMPER